MASGEVRCALCGEPIDPRALGVYRKTTGWAENRRGGGANAIRPPKVEHDEWAHRTCLDRVKKGHRAGQQSLSL